MVLSTGIVAHDSTNMTIKANTIDGFGMGIGASRNKNSEISGNHISRPPH